MRGRCHSIFARDTLGWLAARAGIRQGRSSRSGVLTQSRLQLYGYAIATIYGAFLLSAYTAGDWIVDAKGVPFYTDFACEWVAAVEALRGHSALLYDPAKFVEMQAALVGPGADFGANWPYPPIFLLIMAPFAVLRYGYAFIAWDLTTLFGCIAVVYVITRNPAGIALFLASPFTAWNFLAAQNGFLTTSLLGASLLFLEHRPVLAGVFIGTLAYKPQFGLLFPVALLAARQWRAIASAAITLALLAAASAASFGSGVWVAFPREIFAQTSLNLLAGPDSQWGYLQSVYGLVRTLHGGATLAWFSQALAALGVATVVWFVWRSQLGFSLKAATLSAAALLCTPYIFAYDMAAIAVPVAFLARDQLRHGVLQGELFTMAGLFGAPLLALLVFKDPPVGVTFGSLPIGPAAVVTLLGLILRRALRRGSSPSSLAASAV